MKSILVKIFGFPATLIHGDTLVLDRWLWLTQRLPKTSSPQKIIDVGCGSGAFTIGCAKLGYHTLGLSWDERNQSVAQERAAICRADTATFEIFDIRKLDQRTDLKEQFDIVICLEVIEHILDDKKLMQDIANCLKPSGKLLLTTPNQDYHPITKMDEGPFLPIENGWHVRKGYQAEDLIALCQSANLIVDEISFCSGFLSQKITFLLRTLSTIHPLVGWVITLPLRIIPPLFDSAITHWLKYPSFSICLMAHKSE